MKKGIIGLINNPATSTNSHSAGMVHIVSKLFNADILDDNSNWDDYDQLIIYHGVNFTEGKFNVIGGLNDKIINRCNKLIKYKGIVNTLDGFQLKDFSVKRSLMFNDYKLIEKIELPKRDNLVIGDSHSISVWPNDTYTISRNDGKTLYGFLNQNIDLSKYKDIILYFGNIDVRFHLPRQINYLESTRLLMDRYINYAKRYNATVTHLLPIENISRKIPKSGQYKGANYFGSFEIRSEIRNLCNKMMTESGLNVLEWPDFFMNENRELDFSIMEPGQSVHIRPKYYLRNIPKQLKLFI